MTRRLCLVIDQERCIGCEACTLACKMENGKTAASWMRVATIGGPRKDAPAGRWPDLRMHFLPQPCMHCAEPPCVPACPTGAIAKRGDGPVVLDRERCDGCRVCVDACPYHAIWFDEDAGTAGKCHLCSHRIDQGLDPFCVLCCEGQAMYYGDLNDPESAVNRMVAERKPFVLRPEAGTDPSVYYCPPRPPRGL